LEKVGKRLLKFKLSPVNLLCLFAPGRIVLWLFLLSAFCCSGCTPPPRPPSPIITYPSRIITEDGATFLIDDLRLPGTFQELRLKRGTATMWLQPAQIQSIRFTGPERDRYRLADIWFVDGHRLQAEVFVDVLLEGNADFMYWNMPLSRVNVLQFGTQ
jgi:hypothetical protein